jgi:hypothetical protein
MTSHSPSLSVTPGLNRVTRNPEASSPTVSTVFPLSAILGLHAISGDSALGTALTPVLM